MIRLGLFGLLVLALVLGSQPASASKKRAKRSSGPDSRDASSRKGADDEGDGDGASAPATPPREAPGSKGAAPVANSGSGLPEWAEGTGWTVKSVYRKLPVGHVGKDTKPDAVSIPGWTEPTYWAFHVKKVKATGEVTQYLLQVKNKEGGAAAMASLYFARYPMGPATDVLALNRGKFYTVMSGQLKPTTRPYVSPGGPPHPVLADDSAIPYDFPALPFQAKAPAGAKETELARTFSITEELDEQKYARDVTQVEFQNTTVEAFAGKELADYIKSKGWSTADLSMVEFRRKFDGMRVKQVWSARLPWCIYSESPTVRSWLWDQEEPRPGASPGPSASPSFAPSRAPSPTPSPE